MNKKILSVVVMLVLLAVLFAGCNGQSSEENKFVGTWEASEYNVITFFSDGTCSGGVPGSKYEIKDGKLVFLMYSGGNEFSYAYDYSFSNDDKTLTLTSVNIGNTVVYTKQ